jgi:hypothetical protein
MRAFGAAALCLLPASCFSSNGPVFAENRGRCPFEAPTLYEEVDPNAEGPAARFTFETDGAYCKITDPDGEVTRALFVPSGRNRWIVQGDEERPTYAIMRRSGDRLRQYLPRCQDFSASRLRRLGIAFDEDRRNCTVSEARQVETLFRGRDGRATGAYRRVRD